MSIQPEGEALRNAVKWISEMLQADSEKSISSLINEASAKFDLSPNDGEFLVRFYKKSE